MRNMPPRENRMPASRTGGLNPYFDQPTRSVKEIESEMVSIVNMQKALDNSIRELTTASAINQVERTVVDAVLYIKSFLSLSAGYAIMKTEQAVKIMSNNGYRATVIKNSSDFISVTARKETISKSLNAGIRNLRQIYVLKTTGAAVRKAMKELGNTSEISLYLDSLANSGTGTIEKLYAINDALSEEYNQLAKKRAELLRL